MSKIVSKTSITGYFSYFVSATVTDAMVTGVSGSLEPAGGLSLVGTLAMASTTSMPETTLQKHGDMLSLPWKTGRGEIARILP
jgi:hypothetical protein